MWNVSTAHIYGDYIFYLSHINDILIQVLSAANCEANSVTLGLHKLSLDEGEADEFYNIEHIPIVESVNHPEYKQFTNHWYDLSMMKLQWASQLYADYVVDLDKPDDEIELTIPGNELTILGFGLTGRGGDLPNVLQEGIVDVVPNDVCAASLGVAPDVLDTMFCAVRPGIDTCVGDFGGPVLAKVTQTDQSIRWKQVGVNSKFVRCVDFHGGPGGKLYVFLIFFLYQAKRLLIVRQLFTLSFCLQFMRALV